MQIDLLRHGRPIGGERFRGNGCDDPLDPLGWQQMRDSVSEKAMEWDLVLTSPLRRCRDFAEHLAMERQLPLQVLHDLREIGFGAWEGRSRDELLEQRREEYLAFYANPERNRPPGSEALDAFQERVVSALLPWLSSPEETGRVLVVAHSGVIRATLGWVLNLPRDRLYRLACRYASCSRIRGDVSKGWMLEYLNR